MPELLAYRLEPQDGLDLARHLNEVLMRMVDQAPDRFYALGSVPLQDVEAGHRGSWPGSGPWVFTASNC